MLSTSGIHIKFGDLPQEAQAMLTRHLRIDFSQCSFKAPRWFSAWARNDAGHIVGIFTVEFQTWFNGKVTVLILDPRCCTRRVLRAIFTALFSQAKRLTAEVEPDNIRSLRQVQRLGFTMEGYCPLGLEGCRDTIVFGMLKDECPWLASYVPPAGPSLDVADVALVDTVVGGNFKMHPRVRTYGKDLRLSEFGSEAGLSARRGAFMQVLSSGLPADMSRVDADAVAAGMGGVQLAGWVPVRGDADHAVNAAGFSGHSDVRVPVPPNGMRPKETAVASIRKRGSNGLRS